ncbi:efflux RND transporter periplasmic adaptor subunit [Oleiagrimonas sp.]|jgi:multidrug efflux system membrane fusion protein|uniref:efflux RND transporter periplasmic adaptor subunit n=1 Tax=Oleiagrimonas sp. TaxID=2010330 RepID=UPI002619B50F|nr:efflux RND transporter periplasmic adaptor subunit [Oleiagrimonas sp.]MDA3913062.1 efflux RND transporter periplasmic adaptor subunit [Oleiagrimonas sp.]
MSRWKIALIALVVLVLALLGLRMCHSSSSTAAGAARKGGSGANNGPVPVTAVSVTEQNVPIYLSATGTVQALNTVNVRPQVTGQLMKLTFDEGHEVKKGSVIAKIDPRTYRAQYQQSVARLHQDQAQLSTARSNLSRSEDLVKKNFISKQDLDTQRNTVHQLEATVAGDAASVRDSKVQLDYTDVTAPITGLAGIRQVDPGNVISGSDTIVTLTQVHPIYVVFSLPEQDLDQVRSAQAKMQLPVQALDRVDSHVVAEGGHLTVIDNQIDTSTGTFRLKAQFPNTHDELWPGQFVNVRMKINTVDHGLVIPTQAVQRGPDGDYVYVIGKDDKVQMRTVKVEGEASQSTSLIGSGLKMGERVVTEGQFRLKPGSKVKAYKPGEVPQAPSAEDMKKAAASSGGGGRRH